MAIPLPVGIKFHIRQCSHQTFACGRIRDACDVHGTQIHLMHIRTFDNHGICAKWKIVRKLCGLTAMGPTPDRARRFATDELPISLDLVESNNDQTLGGRV